jgi:PAS domain S-box-containing protein
VRTPMCRYKSGHRGGHTLPRDRFTLQIGMRMKECRRGSNGALQPRVFRLDRWFLYPSRHRIGAWALGMSGSPGTAYSAEDISLLSLIGRVVAFAIDDNFNLRQAEAAQRELQRQNERLQLSEKELQEVIETIPVMAWSAAADGAVEFFNQRWLDCAGLSANQVQGSRWTSAVYPDDLNRLTDYWRGMLASGQSGEIEARLRRFDGTYRWFLFRTTPSLDHGRVVKWYGTNTDIEARKIAEQAIVTQNSRLQLLLKLTKEITSNLELRDLLRAISASIREVMDCDAVHISLADPASGKFRLYALDFPEGKGFVREEMLIESVGACTGTKGRVGGADGAATRMQMNRTTLLARMKKLGIDPRDYA